MKRVYILISFLIFGAGALKAQLPPALQKQLDNNNKVLFDDYEENLYSNGNLESEGTVFFSRYYPITSGEELNDTIKTRIGEWKYYHKNGALKAREWIPLYQDTALVYATFYNKKGIKVAYKSYSYIEEFKALKLNSGDYEVSKPLKYFYAKFHKNGNKKWESYEIDKLPVGEFKSYHENGNVKELITYNEESEKNGDYKCWYSNGTLKIKGGYKKRK